VTLAKRVKRNRTPGQKQTQGCACMCEDEPMCTHACERTLQTHAHTCVLLETHILALMHASMQTSTHAHKMHTHTNTHTCAHRFKHACAHKRVYACKYEHINTKGRSLTSTQHMHMQTHREGSERHVHACSNIAAGQL